MSSHFQALESLLAKELLPEPCKTKKSICFKHKIATSSVQLHKIPANYNTFVKLTKISQLKT